MAQPMVVCSKCGAVLDLEAARQDDRAERHGGVRWFIRCPRCDAWNDYLKGLRDHPWPPFPDRAHHVGFLGVN